MDWKALFGIVRYGVIILLIVLSLASVLDDNYPKATYQLLLAFCLSEPWS